MILRKQKELFAKGSFIIRWDMLWHLYIANRRGRNKEGRAKEVQRYIGGRRSIYDWENAHCFSGEKERDERGAGGS